MANKGDEKLLAKVTVKYHIEKHFTGLGEMNYFCEEALKKLKEHPSSPEPDNFVDNLSEEDLSEVQEGILRELNSIKLEDYELSEHLEELGELEDDDSVYLFGAAAAPPPPGKFKKLKLYFSKRKDEPKETVEPAEPLEESSGWKMVRKAHKRMGEKYDKLKANCKKALSSKDDEERSSGRRMNTPVSKEEIARQEIGNMIREILLMLLENQVYGKEITKFKGDFKLLKLYESSKDDELLNEKCSKSLRDAMNRLITYRASTNFVFNEMADKLDHNEIYVHCSKLYEAKQLTQPKPSKRFFGMAFGRSKGDKKGKRKSGAEEDEKPLLGSDDSDDPSPSPKRTKDEADEEVIRRLRKTSVTDEDDDIKDVAL